MTYVLVDDWLYMDVDGDLGAYSREEVQREVKPRIKTVTATFIDCDTKIITVPQGSGAHKEELINAAFSNEYLIQEERLSSDMVQIIAAKKERIEDIYEYFKPVAVTVLVPYPVGLRAFLKSRSVACDDRMVVFVDDLKTRAIVTILEGLRFTCPRRISTRDLADMAAEIKRSQHNYLAQRSQSRGAEASFVIIANNREWLSAFIEQGLMIRENAVYMDAVFPVLEGLKTAKFGIHFALPGELVRKKRRLIAQQRLKTALIGISFAAIGSGLYGMGLVHQNNTAARLRQSRLEQQKGLDDLKALYQRKFRQLLFQYKDLPYEHLYYDFVENVPADYGIKEFSVVQMAFDHWEVSALIYPVDDDAPYRDFHCQGMFARAQITAVTIDKRLGQRIDLSINLNHQIQDLHALKDDPIKDISSYYRDVYEHLRVLGGFNDFKRIIVVDGLPEGGAVVSAAKASRWEGIRRILFKVNFYEFTGTDQYLRIFQALTQLRQAYPLNITSIKQSGDNLEIMIELYGK